MRFFLVFSFALALLAIAGCTRAPAATDAGSRPDVGSHDTGHDAPAVSCTTDGECDDGFGCTFDQCVVGNVCMHTTNDTLCAAGERCVVGTGCTSGGMCSTAADCDDHVYCNGTEQCLDHTCFPLADRNCDDGLSCTIDSCDESAGACSYMTVCDSGVAFTDAAAPCDPFMPATGYTGSFRIVPAPMSSCGAATFSVDTATFSISGGMLNVTAGPFSLTGSIPTDATFHVTGNDGGCGDYVLDGTFDCADRFSGMWHATFGGECSFCSNQSSTVLGLAR
jgi:hypothetical protein